MIASKNAFESFRDVVQDLLVPELKALKVSVDSMREDMNYMRADIGSLRTDLRQSHEALRSDLRQSHEALRDEIKLRDAANERMIAYGDQRNEQLILSFIEKFDKAMDVRERLAAMEAKLPK
jgi:hypothetical protein